MAMEQFIALAAQHLISQLQETVEKWELDSHNFELSSGYREALVQCFNEVKVIVGEKELPMSEPKAAERTALSVAGHSTDHIWAMEHDDEIGLRFDCGDAGTLMLSKSQARDVIETLEAMLGTTSGQMRHDALVAARIAGAKAILGAISKLSHIVPSELSAEEQWNRNGEYIYLDDIKALAQDLSWLGLTAEGREEK